MLSITRWFKNMESTNFTISQAASRTTKPIATFIKLFLASVRALALSPAVISLNPVMEKLMIASGKDISTTKLIIREISSRKCSKVHSGPLQGIPMVSIAEETVGSKRVVSSKKAIKFWNLRFFI